MFKIVEEHPTQLEKEFKAVKEMTKENFNFDFFLYGFFAIWPLVLLISMLDYDFLTIFVAGSVVLSGLGFFLYIVNPAPRRYRILYKKHHSH